MSLSTHPSRSRCTVVLALLASLALLATAAACSPAPAAPTNDTLHASGSLTDEGEIRSANDYSFVMHANGNAVLYRPSPGGRVPLWATDTAGNPGARLVMEEDGNLVVYDVSDRVLWTNQQRGAAGSALVIRPNGNLVQVQPIDGGRREVWSTGTGSDRTGVGCPTGEHYAVCERSASQARTDTAARAIKFAIRQLGVPYSTAGRFGPHGYDCSGLMWQAFAHAGVDIGASVTSTIVTPGGPRRTVSMGDVRPGDMVWYPGHIAMALADGRIIEAAKPGTLVRIVGAANRGFSRAVTIDAA